MGSQRLQYQSRTSDKTACLVVVKFDHYRLSRRSRVSLPTDPQRT